MGVTGDSDAPPVALGVTVVVEGYGDVCGVVLQCNRLQSSISTGFIFLNPHCGYDELYASYQPGTVSDTAGGVVSFDLHELNV